MIHPTAVINPRARIGAGVEVGPYCIIEEDVTIGDRTVLLSHVHVGKGTVIGEDNFIHMGAVLGHEAQVKNVHPGQGQLIVGKKNVFREYVTVHRSSSGENATRIGDNNYFMGFCHIGHDSQVGHDTTLANAVLVGGHAALEDHCVLGGGAGVHQLCRVGCYAMIGGRATITKDLPPYMIIDDSDDRIGSLNVVGINRAGFSEETKREIKTAYKTLYWSDLTVSDALDQIERNCHSSEVAHLVTFIRESKRGVLGHRRQRLARVRRAL